MAKCDYLNTFRCRKSARYNALLWNFESFLTILRACHASPNSLRSRHSNGDGTEMKTWKLLFSSVFLGTALIPTAKVQASFSELDIVVRESIESHFREYGYSVDLNKLEYRGEPKLEAHENQILTIHTVVWAEQRQIAPHWGWHECETRILVQGPGLFVDQGSRCYFTFD